MKGGYCEFSKYADNPLLRQVLSHPSVVSGRSPMRLGWI